MGTLCVSAQGHAPHKVLDCAHLLHDFFGLLLAMPGLLLEKKKKNHYIFSSQPRADQMPGPPREGQLMCTLFLSTHQ